MKIRSLLFIFTVSLFFSCSDESDPYYPVSPSNSKNPWDGKYRIEGSLTDTDSEVTWPGNEFEYHMITNSRTQLRVISNDLDFEGHLIRIGGSLSYYGTFGLIVNLDRATNKITSITNSYGQPSVSGRSAVLDPSGENKWDPVTKNIRIKYWMDQDGVHKTAFDETWVYIGAR